MEGGLKVECEHTHTNAHTHTYKHLGTGTHVEKKHCNNWHTVYGLSFSTLFN